VCYSRVGEGIEAPIVVADAPDIVRFAVDSAKTTDAARIPVNNRDCIQPQLSNLRYHNKIKKVSKIRCTPWQYYARCERAHSSNEPPLPPVDVCTVGKKNNIQQMMIKYIGKTYAASMELGSDPADTYEIFPKLNESP
jgi:hypothetical protein